MNLLHFLGEDAISLSLNLSLHLISTTHPVVPGPVEDDDLARGGQVLRDFEIREREMNEQVEREAREGMVDPAPFSLIAHLSMVSMPADGGRTTHTNTP